MAYAIHAVADLVARCGGGRAAGAPDLALGGVKRDRKRGRRGSRSVM
jgi:hypothetical protein